MMTYSFADGLRPGIGALGLALALTLTCGEKSLDAASPASDPESWAEREARGPLYDLDASGLTGFEPVLPGQVPNYLRVFAALPEGAPLLGEVARSVLYDGTIDPDLKIAIGFAIAQPDCSPYTAAHMRRLLPATSGGRMLLDAIEDGSLQGLHDQDRIAIEWALALTETVEGLDDEGFHELRRHFTEPQIVELTLTTCFFSYFTRLVETLNLPIEPWVMKPAANRITTGSFGSTSRPQARIGLLQDDEVRIIAERLAAGEASSSLGLRIANSVRAMARVPETREAWANLGTVLRDSTIGPVIQHLVSNEVSYRNDCYYCKTHQVQKLYREGWTAKQIARVVDSDDELDERAQRAVRFARQVTDDPTAVTDEQFESLREAFGDRGALEILHVAARFNFMNRFTSGLGLPPEDGPRETYESVEAARARSAQAAP